MLSVKNLLLYIFYLSLLLLSHDHKTSILDLRDVFFPQRSLFRLPLKFLSKSPRPLPLNFTRAEHASTTVNSLLFFPLSFPKSITALLKNTRIVKFKSQMTITFFAAVNHLSGPLRKQNFTSAGSKGHVWDLPLVDFDSFWVFLCFKVRCL